MIDSTAGSQRGRRVILLSRLDLELMGQLGDAIGTGEHELEAQGMAFREFATGAGADVANTTLKRTANETLDKLKKGRERLRRLRWLRARFYPNIFGYVSALDI